MGLQVWLPLNGNLKNQGLYNSAVEGKMIGTAATYENGKIGKCIKVNSSSYFKYDITVPKQSFDFSWCTWVKIPSSMKTNTSWEIMIEMPTSSGNKVSSWQSYQQLKIYDCTNQQCAWLKPGTDFKYDEWFHLVVTHSLMSSGGTGTAINIYINGIQYSTTFNKPNEDVALASGVIQLGRGITVGEAYFNDFRVYDHCLSPKEVKEISKALILHYPLKQPERSRNLIPTATAQLQSSNCTTNQNTLYTLNGQDFIQGQKYTYSGYFENTGTKIIKLRVQWYNSGSDRGGPISTVAINPGDKGWYLLVFTYPTNKTYQQLQLLMDGNSNTSITSSTYNYSCVKLEAGENPHPIYSQPADNDNPIEYDCSGFGNNGSVAQATCPSGEPDSPRYNMSYRFNSDRKDIIQIPAQRLQNITNNGQQTLSCWFKTSGLGTNMQINGLIALGYGDSLYLNGGGTPSGRVDNGTNLNQVDSGVSYKDNQWHFQAMTYDGTTVKVYVDGVLKNSAARTMANRYVTSGHFAIGTEANAPSKYMMNGCISDVRIYATALSDDDIRELYVTSALITNSGAVMAYEFIE